MHFNSFLPPIKKKKKVEIPEPSVRNAETSTVDFNVEETSPLSTSDSAVDGIVANVVVAVEEVGERVDNIFAPKILFLEPAPEFRETDAVTELPTKTPTQERPTGSGCKKHSRCHCSLFSKETDGFFAVQPNK
jgi:hypothetical protein